MKDICTRECLLLLLLCFVSTAYSQEITEENFQRIDSLLWSEYQQTMDSISSCYEKYPDKRDSLSAVSREVYAVSSRKNIENAIRFASIPCGLQRLFMVRLEISKDTLLPILKSLPREMQDSPYGRSILSHIHSKQMKEGEPCYDFKATDVDGKDFLLSSLRGKMVLFVYDGLGCMGQSGRDYLDSLYRKTSREDLQIVVYGICEDLKELEAMKVRYPFDYIFVSDFLLDHSPIKIIYGAQSTPTSFLIDPWGTVVFRSGGINFKRINELLFPK